MAFLRKLTGRSNPAPEKKEEFVLNYPSGQISFTQAETKLFNDLALVLDVEGTDTISGRHGALFLRRSNLNTDQLRVVWREACEGTSKPCLSRDNFFVACKLVALAQSKKVVSMDPLYANEVLPFPNFEINKAVPRQVGPVRTAPVGPSEFTAGVTNPTVVGTGMSRYTAYNVDSSTSLPTFPRRVMSVLRRYSDFEWLQDMLAAQYGGCLLPALPLKKSFGNMDPAFIEQRRLALDTYLKRVVRHPRLIESFALQVFLDATQEGFAAFQALVESGIAGGTLPIPESGVLGSLWSSLSSALPSTGLTRVPTVKLAEDDEYKARVNAHVREFQQLVDAAHATKAMIQSRRDCAYAIARLGSYLLELSAHETRGESAGASAFAERRRRDAEAGAEPVVGTGAGLPAPAAPKSEWAGTAFGGGAAPEQELGWGSYVSNEAATAALFEDDDDLFGGPIMPVVAAPAKKKVSRYAKITPAASTGDVSTSSALFTNFGGAVESVSNVLQDQLDHIQKVFANPLYAEMAGAVAVKNAVQRRADAVEELQQMHAALAVKKRSYAAARASGDNADIAHAEMTNAETDVERSRTKVKTITDTLKTEMRAWDRAKRVKTTRMLLELAKAEARNCRERNARWVEVMDNTSKDQTLREASARRIAPCLMAVQAPVEANIDTVADDAFH